MRASFWRRGSAGLGLLVVLAALAVGCGSSASGDGTTGAGSTAASNDPPRVLSTQEAKQLLQQLPYRYEFRKVKLPEGATGAVAGTAIGKHHTVLHFGVSLGTEAGAVPVPQAGVRDPYDYSAGGGFVFNDDLVVAGGVGKQFKTGAQWEEATSMEVEMEEKLCKAATGEPCPP
ncbi:MAG: hypothetical protein ACTHN3_12325 [Solirubrobacterales bacterium]